MSGRLEGRAAIVTGGASGIGRACALRFAEEGADVLIADLDEERAAPLVDEIAALGRKASFSRTDTSVEADAEAMADCAMRELGRVDILLAAAGISHAGYKPGEGMNRTSDFESGHLLNKPLEDWSRVLAINTNGILLTNRAAARRMIDCGRGGAIVNVTSLAALTPTAGLGDYCVSKAAAWMMTRVLALELGPRGIRVNAIAPGVTETPMTRVMLSDPAVREQLLETIPLRRFGEARDVANAALFLASDESSYISGKSIPVDGVRYPG